MISKRQLLIWLLAAVAGIGLLLTVVIGENRRARRRFSTFLSGNPQIGARLFQQKGCNYCHALNGIGGKLGPDLGAQPIPKANLGHLVTAMWNHAPTMWEQMRLQEVPYPTFDQEEMAHLFAFLYTARYADEPGDANRGGRLFRQKGCAECHAVKGEGGKVAPDLATTGKDTPIAWAQAMWNHAPEMENRMREMKLHWPRFREREMNDLLAYVREVSGGLRHENRLLPANPERGWKVFQSKSCSVCHSISGGGGGTGPELGPKGKLPATIVQFAGAMWSHSPEMWQAMKAKRVQRPTFQDREMADLVAFLYQLRYFGEPGSPQIGKSVFEQLGCAKCHGPTGAGGTRGPTLRGEAAVTPVTLATALWEHGPTMHQETRKAGMPWPAIRESEINSLVAFLNAPVEGEKP